MTGKRPRPIDDSTSGTDDPSPPDLGALRRTDELFDELSERRAVSADGVGDPALALLKALVDDVDVGAPPLSRPGSESRTGRPPGRLPRTLVSLCVVTTVLMTTGVAAAGGELTSFAPAQSKSEPHVQTPSDLREARDVARKGRYDSAPRRRGTVPRRSAAAAKADHEPKGLASPRPLEVTPRPRPISYDLYGAPVDPQDPAPGSSVSPSPSPSPSPEPSVTPLGASGQGSAEPGQGPAQPDVVGQESPAPSQQGSVP